MTDNPYAPPQAPLATGGGSGASGSLEGALRGDFDISVGSVTSEGWSLVRGNKAKLIGGLFLAYLIMIVVQIALAFVGLSGFPLPGSEGPPPGFLASMAGTFLALPITGPLYAGLFMLGVRRAAGQPAGPTEVLAYYDRVVPLTILFLVQTILTYLGFLLLIIPGIYLAVAWFAGIPLVVDKGLSPWQALETSRKAISKQWFSLFGFFLVAMIVLVVSVLPLGIGLIWSMPWFFLCFGVIYRRVFGVGPAV